MARTYIDIPLHKDREQAEISIKNILTADDYRPIAYGVETVWKKGTGLATAMHFIKYEIKGNILHIEGWVQVGIGSFGGKERDLEGFSASIPKKSVLNTIEKIRVIV